MTYVVVIRETRGRSIISSVYADSCPPPLPLPMSPALKSSPHLLSNAIQVDHVGGNALRTPGNNVSGNDVKPVPNEKWLRGR